MGDNISRRAFLKKAGLAALVGTSFVGSCLVGQGESEASEVEVLYPVARESIKVADPLSGLRTAGDVKKYVRGNLDALIPGCEYFTWGDATTNGYKGGVRIPDPEVLPYIIDTANDFERFVLPRLAESGIEWTDLSIVSFFRPLDLDKKLSPNNNKRRTHPYGVAVDFATWKIPAEKLYGMLGKEWEGGLGKYLDRNSVHWDRGGRKRWG